jgi:hypothetical protein
LATIALVAATIRPRPAHAEDKRVPVVAVFELEDATNRPRRLIASLTDYLRVKLAETQKLKVVDKGDQEAQLKKIIRSEKKRSYKACMDQSCQIPLGKELAADKILRGKVTRFGKSYVIAIEMIDLATGASAGAASEKSAGTEEELMGSVERVAKSITASVAPKEELASATVDPPPEEKPKLEVASTTAQASNAGAVQAPPTTAQVKMESPGPTGGQWTMIIGGFAVFAGAYITEVLAQLIGSDFSRAYYSLLPVGGPVLVELLNKSTVDANGNPYKSQPLNYVDAGIQAVGAGIGILGIVLASSNPPVAVQPATPAPATQPGQTVSIDVIALPHFLGLHGTF